MQATVRAVEAMKLTTLMVTHNMQHAVEFGHRLVMLDAGRNCARNLRRGKGGSRFPT